MKRRAFTICLMFTFILLFVACNQSISDELPLVDDTQLEPTTFELAPDLIVNPDINGRITIDVEISEDHQTLTEIITHDFDRAEIFLNHPSLEYFDGENWYVIPSSHDFEDVLLHVEPQSTWEGSLILNFYDHPKYGLFRLRRRFVSDYVDHHDIVVKFTLD